MKLSSISAISIYTISVSSGATIVQTETLDTAHIYASGSGTGITSVSISVDFNDYHFTFQEFDPSLGTLTGVSFSNSLTHQMSATVGTGGTTSLRIEYVLNYTANGIQFSGDGNGNGTVSEIPGAPLLIEAEVSTNNSPIGDAFHSEFEGSGTVDFGILRTSAGSRTFNAELEGFLTDYSIQRNPGAFVTLTYTYDPVPEPTSGVLLISAIFGILIRRKR